MVSDVSWAMDSNIKKKTETPILASVLIGILGILGPLVCVTGCTKESSKAITQQEFTIAPPVGNEDSFSKEEFETVEESLHQL